MSSPDPALSRRNAHLFLLAVLVSGFGSTAMALVAGVWAKELTGSDAAAGWMSVAMWAPVVAAPWLGGIADRLGHRRVLVGGNLLIGAVLLSLVFVEHGGGVPLLGVVVGLYGLSFVVLDVAEGAVLPDMVSDRVLADINGRRMALQEGAKIVAPAAGAALYVLVGGAGVAMLDAATFLVAGMAVAAMRPLGERPQTASAPRLDAVGIAAVRLLRDEPALWRSTLLGSSVMLAAGTAGPVMFAVVDEALGRPAAFLGVLAALQGPAPWRRGSPSALSCAGGTGRRSSALGPWPSSWGSSLEPPVTSSWSRSAASASGLACPRSSRPRSPAPNAWPRRVLRRARLAP